MMKGLHLSMAVVGAAVLGVASFVAWADTSPASAPAASPSVSAERVAGLVAQLGDDSRERREQAVRELTRIGLPAVAALRKAAGGGDPEIAAQAATLMNTLADSCLRWKAPLPAGLNQGLAISKDLAIFHGGDKKLHAVSLADGSEKWTFDTGLTPHPGNVPLLETLDDVLVFSPWQNDARRLLAVDLPSGEQLWRHDDRHATALVGADYLLCFGRGEDGEYDRMISRLSPTDGQAVWTLDGTKLIEPTSYPHPIPIPGPDACLLQFTRPTRANEADKTGWSLAVLEVATGKKRWEKQEFGGYPYSYDIAGGRLYCVYDEANNRPGVPERVRVRVFDFADGTEVETKLDIDAKAIHPGFHAVVKVAGETLLYGATKYQIAAYDVASGKEMWRHVMRGTGGQTVRMTNPPWHHATMAVHEGHVLLADPDALVALDLKTGKPLWRYPVAAGIAAGPVVREGVVYFLSGGEDKRQATAPASCHLYALDLDKVRQFGAD